jgi:U32 family peptidase
MKSPSASLPDSQLTDSQLPEPVELLAPAGNWQCARAAVENGADAIYFGLDVGFNARARADNFHADDLPGLMDMLHRQAVRGYVTLNTLVFTDELTKLESNVRMLAAAGVDAVLVQDIGVARLIRLICPELEVHASTQMTLTNASAIDQVRELGIRRVVLARELSIREIAQIHAATSMPLEVFVHGALCVAYSGQCLTSESLGGRSANRGQCAQACRLPYQILCDGQVKDLGQTKYLLSPQDLAAHDLIPQLIAAGVCSLKIEGRLKTPEYVANVCQHYRRAIDLSMTGKHRPLSETQKRELELSFSRGFSPGWLEGCDHKRLVPGDSSSKRGVELGRLVRQKGDRIVLDLTCPLSVGDGLVVEGDRLAGDEIGGRVYELRVEGRRVDAAEQGIAEIALQRGLLDKFQLEPGLRVFKTDDPQLTKRLRRTFHAADPAKRVPIALKVIVQCGQPIRLTAHFAAHFAHPGAPLNGSDDCRTVEIQSEYVPEMARKHPTSAQLLEEQLRKIGRDRVRTGSVAGRDLWRPNGATEHSRATAPGTGGTAGSCQRYPATGLRALSPLPMNCCWSFAIGRPDGIRRRHPLNSLASAIEWINQQIRMPVGQVRNCECSAARWSS